jgi:hypothetical protein
MLMETKGCALSAASDMSGASAMYRPAVLSPRFNEMTLVGVDVLNREVQ